MTKGRRFSRTLSSPTVPGQDPSPEGASSPPSTSPHLPQLPVALLWGSCPHTTTSSPPQLPALAHPLTASLPTQPSRQLSSYTLPGVSFPGTDPATANGVSKVGPPVEGKAKQMKPEKAMQVGAEGPSPVPPSICPSWEPHIWLTAQEGGWGSTSPRQRQEGFRPSSATHQLQGLSNSLHPLGLAGCT